MELKLHKNAKTTPSLRKTIQESSESINKLSKKYNLSWSTVKKWKESKSIEDKSSKPHKIRTDLTLEEEVLICFERKQYKKTIEEIYFSLESKFIDKKIYPVKIYRCLKRYNLNVLPEEFVNAERQIKKFKKYKIGYLHIDSMYIPKINGVRYYIFTCIDRICKVAFICITNRKDRYNGAKFLSHVLEFYPYKVNYILTDNGCEFSYKFLRPGKKTKKTHPFDKVCKDNDIQHRTIKFKHPWTNGMIERFNRKIREKVIKKHLFTNLNDLDVKVIDYINDYNFNVKLRGLGYKTPSQYLKEQLNLDIKYLNKNSHNLS